MIENIKTQKTSLFLHFLQGHIDHQQKNAFSDVTTLLSFTNTVCNVF